MATLYEEVRAALRQSGFRPRKSRGQNFLIHERVLDSIIGMLDLAPQDAVVEIGPGLGFLTRRLVGAGAEVWAVEIDAALVDRLNHSPLAAHPSFHLVHADVLEVALDAMLPRRKIKLAGNLPYSIATPALFRIFEWRDHFTSIVLMVQREVADRIAARPGGKTYGTLSVWSQLHGRITDRIQVSPEAFYPRPKVRSTILKIELFAEPLIGADDMPALQKLVRAAFGQRRKTLGNALAGLFDPSTRAPAGAQGPSLGISPENRGVVLSERSESKGDESGAPGLSGGLHKRSHAAEAFLLSAGIDPKRRGETLGVDEFIRLARRARVNILPATTD